MKSLYSRRAERLRKLATDNPLGDYLNFAAQLAEAQHHALHDNPLQLDLTEALQQGAASGKPPLDLSVYPRSEHWHRLLGSLIAELRPQAPEHILAVLDNLEKASAHELELMADALLNREFGKIGSEKAPFIWAALSLYWAQMASLIPARRARNMASIASSARCAAAFRSPAWCISAPSAACAICTATCAKASGTWCG
ncbi:formate dehydrogenase accessory protein FdhE [Serratia plymuthica]|uniref:Formate dehydrogenase accessory protein FdhE n=1 Tax=Serratia plymuthica TaxID=82996 RepID=A0A2X4U1X7_SERPL|nr:formate dehydrogenase accessory protein FdhE [Serratia plymuthica]